MQLPTEGRSVIAHISIIFQGRPLPRGTDKLVDVSHDDSGEYIPEGLDESSMSRDPSSMRRAPTSNTEEFDPANQENLVNGSYGRPNGSTDMLPGNDSAGRMPNGAQYRRPVPMQRSIDGLDRVPTTNGYDPRAPDELSPHSPTEEAMISSAGAPLQVSNEIVDQIINEPICIIYSVLCADFYICAVNNSSTPVILFCIWFYRCVVR